MEGPFEWKPLRRRQFYAIFYLSPLSFVVFFYYLSTNLTNFWPLPIKKMPTSNGWFLCQWCGNRMPAKNLHGWVADGFQWVPNCSIIHRPTHQPTNQPHRMLNIWPRCIKLRSIFDISECHTLNSELLWTLIQHKAQVQNVQSVALMSRKIVKS